MTKKKTRYDILSSIKKQKITQSNVISLTHVDHRP